MRGSLKKPAAAAALLLASASALAIPEATLQWIQPGGTTSGSDVVEIWVRLTVSPTATESLVLDGTTTGIAPEILAEFAEVSGVYNGSLADCVGTFWPQSGCYDAGSAWIFNFYYGDGNFGDARGTLAPGQSQDFLYATFTPQNGPVTPGTYTFSNAELQFNIVGLDFDGNALYRNVTIAATCPGGEDACAFSRVVAVPEPGTYGMMALGLGLLGWVARRRAR